MNFKLLTILFLIVFSFSSCSKDDDDTSGGVGGVGEGIMIAKIDDITYSNTNNWSGAKITSLSTTFKLAIQSSNSDGKSIEIVVFGFSGVGTYKIQPTGNHPHRGYYKETDITNPSSFQLWQAPCANCPSGMVKITEETSTAIKGEFNFVVHNPFANSNADKTLYITEGFFNLRKQ